MKTSMRTAGILAAALFVCAAIGFNHLAAQQATSKKGEAEKEAKGAPDERAADEKAIRASAASFVKAFNAGDAKAAAEQFLPNAEFLSAEGKASSGREAIEKDMAAYFKEYPKAKIAMEIDSIRFIGPRVAIEEGRTSVTHTPDSAPVEQNYISVDLLVDGEWKLGSVREFPAESEPATPHDFLEPLAWMVGNWVDESAAGIAETTCKWSDDGNWLLQDFQLKIGGNPAITGQQRIGYDALTGQIKSWVFDSQGGYSEALWTADGDRWIVKSSGVRPDGTTASATNILTPRDKDSYLYESKDRIASGALDPDVRVTVVRKPPSPGSKSAEPKK